MDLRFIRNLNEWELNLVSTLIMLLDLVNFCEAAADRREGSEMFSSSSFFKELTKVVGSFPFQSHSFVVSFSTTKG